MAGSSSKTDEGTFAVANNEAGWTFYTLKKYLDERLRAAEMAVAKAEIQISHRFDSVNEFRGALTDLSNRMIPRSEYDIQHKALSDKIAVNEERLAAIQLALTELSAKNVGQRQGLGIIGSLVMGVITTISVISSVVLVIFHMK